VTQYQVIPSPAVYDQYGNQVGFFGTDQTNYTMTGLVNGTRYTFTVKAFNVSSPSAASDPSNYIIPGDSSTTCPSGP